MHNFLKGMVDVTLLLQFNQSIDNIKSVYYYLLRVI